MTYAANPYPSLWLLALGLAWFTGCREERPLFTEMPPAETGIDFANHLTESEDLNINQYLYAHNGGGVAIGDIDNDGLADIYFTSNQLANRLYRNLGDFRFQDITEAAGVAGTTGERHWKTGVVMADVNGDGYLDLYVSQVARYRGFDGTNQLFINNGDGTFTDRAAAFGLDLESYSQQAAFFDYDLDGDLDLYQLNHSVHNPDVYIHAGQRNKRDPLAGDRLFRNDNGVFVDVSDSAGIYGGATGYGLAVGIGDIDQNGCPDIYVSNDFHENDYVYYNNCDGTFREDVMGTLGHSSTFSMGNDIADVNNDGRLDILTLDMMPEDEVIRKKSAGPDPYNIYDYKLNFGYFYQSPRNMLQVNRGNLFADNVQFSEVGQLAGIHATDWSWAGLLTDLDNDGWKDIFVANGIVKRPIDLDYINFTYDDEVQQTVSSLEMVQRMPDGAAPNYAYRNRGDLTFENTSEAWGLDRVGYSMGAAYGDLDGDGDLDLVVNNLNDEATVYRNRTAETTENNSLSLTLAGPVGNPFGIGARVELEVPWGKIVQEQNPGRGWLSSVDPVMILGSGTLTDIPKLTVTWPDGKIQELSNVPVAQSLRLDYADAREPSASPPTLPVAFRDITDESGLDFQHRENAHVDFNFERLLPHKLSVEGPRMAEGDVNGDGLIDLYVGGAFGQSGQLYLQAAGPDGTPRFTPSPQKAFRRDTLYEDAQPVFLDADGDGDLDLYVASGGGQLVHESLFQDRLYRNDGEGGFTLAPAAVPNLQANASCVVAADFNGDHFPDLFVGTRSMVGKYGVSPDSYVLVNDGRGRFSVDTTDRTASLRGLGMVTDATWLAKERSLAVVGHWMPVTFLDLAGDGMFTKRALPGTSGWWNTVHPADLDGDGDDDLLLGNRGLNSSLTASVEEPLRLYLQDFDRNLTVDPILTYYRHGKEWIYPGLNELKEQLPTIRLQYPTYAEYAEHTFPEMMPEHQRAAAEIREVETFVSGYLLNEGGGNYTFHALPQEAQYAPIHAFTTADVNGDGRTDVFAAGNFHDNMPSVGRFDASYGNLLLRTETGFDAVDAATSGFAVYGETRDLTIFQNQNTITVVAARNDAPLRVLYGPRQLILQ
ncbi:VCBS repeat protein [Neolewinella xylanilytica]|uniref:VCBS repeat protein n=1 Tax=Neolewinella xylanilytica TaxID=1514080 RepID=A0A2S6I8C5_9BACT|nr:VCBS repeat-containing protein [Neolewinella xylanilytica]PPK87738.1 VCBS repeat protein [Neolewinella xylanilytica]